MKFPVFFLVLSLSAAKALAGTSHGKLRGPLEEEPALLIDGLDAASSLETEGGVGDHSCGSAIQVGPNAITLTKFEVRNKLSMSGYMKFMVWEQQNDGPNQLAYVSAPKKFTDKTMSWKASDVFTYELKANTKYDVGAIADVASDWAYDFVSESQNGITTLLENPVWANYHSPMVIGHGTADCAVRLYGHVQES